MKQFSFEAIWQLLLLANVLAVCCFQETAAAPKTDDDPQSQEERTHASSKQLPKHRHRWANSNNNNGNDESRQDGGRDGSFTGGATTGEDGELENFIALAPDEADIYNFSNNLINAVDSAVAAAAATGGSDGPARPGSRRGTTAADANEANPFNEFLNPRQHEQQSQPEIPPEMDDDEAEGGTNGGGDDGNQKVLDPWGFDEALDEQLPAPEEQQQQAAPPQEEPDTSMGNEIGKSPSEQQQQSPLVASSVDFLNSIDGGYLLSNGIIDEKGRKLMDENEPSTLKPEGGAAVEEGEQVNDDDILEQMQKKAKSYRLKLYKKHKNFKHSHHHRGGYYHPMYQQHHHHQYYRQKMLERERDRWKQIHDQQQLKSGYQGKIRYFDSSNKLETKDDIKAHLDGYSSREQQWPHFETVMNSLNKEQQQDNVPPYIKKYNRRNKQLIDLLEGTIAPLSDYSQRHHERKYHRRKNPHWMEEDLFEEQRPSPNNLGMQRNYIQETIQSSTAHSNALPGEGIHIIYEKKHNNDDDHDYGHATTSMDPNHPYKLSSRAGQFVYHRVASPQPIGAGYGRLKRQRLPFVAITDRRLGSPPKRRPNAVSGSSSSGAATNIGSNSGSNNLLNHQPMP
ncbi:uncharacterized protein LOC129739856 isoform X2 [Uranotaenia lowii]|uniref:uncharacterized protein LOC129739856 isoform X2 n=1 Tax=Uranotaenia lowii TaxID=190385 RepID=UPI0024790229|nr:uncharacterized protein LOC129739856 isoform X2 [Uranotaenia lowii]